MGVGNVAMDVTRILASDPDDLATTDITHALAALRASRCAPSTCSAAVDRPRPPSPIRNSRNSASCRWPTSWCGPRTSSWTPPLAVARGDARP